MKISESTFLKTLLFSFFLLGMTAGPEGNSVFAAKKKKAAKNNVSEGQEVVRNSTETEDSASASDSAGTKISVPKKQISYFSKIDQKILSGIEDGSPDSVIQSLQIIRKSEDEYRDNEKVLVSVGASIMDIVWPSVHFSFDVPSVDFYSPYTGAVEFVRNGYFDSSTGNVDFLSSILPALVLVTEEELSDTVLTQCESALLSAASYNDSSVLLDYLSGIYYMRRGDFEKSRSFFEKLYISNSGVFEISQKYAVVKFNLKEYQSAYEIARGLLEKNPIDLKLLELNAKITFAMENFTMAEEYVGRALQQMPNNLDFLLFRVKILIEKGDYIHANSHLDSYGRQNDTNLDYLLLRTKVLLDWSKNVVQATEHIEKALSLYPDSKEAMLVAARIASMTDAPVAGKFADELVEQILKENPDNPEALGYALNALERRGLWQSAYEISHRLVQDEKLSSEIIAKHVDICLHLEKKSEALRVAEKAYESRRDDDTILQSYILAQLASGNTSQSLSLINSLLETSSKKMKSFLYFRRSFLQTTESAVMADLRRSIVEDRRNSDALFSLYEIYYKKEDYSKAQYYLKQVVALNPNDTKYKNLNEALTRLIK